MATGRKRKPIAGREKLANKNNIGLEHGM